MYVCSRIGGFGAEGSVEDSEDEVFVPAGDGVTGMEGLVRGSAVSFEVGGTDSGMVGEPADTEHEDCCKVEQVCLGDKIVVNSGD